MPHTSRRKRQQFSHRKYKEEHLEDGWTRVTRADIRPDDHGYQMTVVQDQLPPEEVGLTIAKLTKTFDSYTAKWTQSEAKRKVDHIIEKRAFVEDDHDKHFTTGVLIALGSLARVNYQNQARSMWQLVCFMDMVKTSKFDFQPQYLLQDYPNMCRATRTLPVQI